MKTELMNVKGIEVTVTATELKFVKDDVEFVLNRQIGKSDYRIVYEAMKRKGQARNTDGYKSVGRFSYRFDEDKLLLTVRNYKDEVILEQTILEDDEINNLRNYVINWILNNTSGQLI